MAKINEIIIEDTNTPHVRVKITCRIENNGDLKLDSHTIGGITQEVFGSDDDEYIVRVKQEFKDTILLHLVRERFKRESEFVE